MQPARLPPDWPFRAQGRRIDLAPHRFWLADVGEGPPLLLLHGTGASGHSFRSLTLPGHRCLIPDLPGQGASESRAFDRMTLDGMAEDLWRLMDVVGVQPRAILGHSAGAAIALRMAELRPGPAVVGINAALGGFDGLAALLFPVLAKVLAAAPYAAPLAARLWGRPGTVARLLEGTGSPLDARGRAMYTTLVQDPGHVAGALAMMAGWRLEGLLSRLPQTPGPVWLIAAPQDRAVPPRVSEEAARRIPGCRLTLLPGGGHLVHEETDLGPLILEGLAQASQVSPGR